MIRFRLFGIPVQVQPFFWITLALLGGALHARSPESFLKLGLFLIAGFISILVHELGHALTARSFGAWSEITLQAFGGYATCSGKVLSRPKSFLVTAAGPAIQIALGLGLWFSGLLDRSPNENTDYFIATLMWISLFWAAINLLPILPLDGGRMLDAILGPRRIRITLWITILTCAAMILVVLDLTRDPLPAIFLAMFGWQAIQTLRQLGPR